ncbi:low-density lipoprotein receptor-related protein 2 [Nephila pilipes]|uniref:Low-density lipoprotein receptor-related protein 2 n=1 Tax=Nephila pilipes TaxID=299642 RepID=A0A8X6QZT9_NEPPI|nr:low-density lipoprotein receptor-related protein 2 [Nephila pilipes]
MRATQIVGVLFLWTVFHCVRATTVPCTPETFKCLNGNCIKRSEYCNYKNDCPDTTDERYCGRQALSGLCTFFGKLWKDCWMPFPYGEAISVQYSVWIGDKIELARTWSLKMLQNSSIYDVIETVAKIDNRQMVEYNVVEGKPFVTSLGGLEDDPETGTFWFVHLRSLKSDGQPEMMEQSPMDLKLKPDQEVILI